MNTYAEVKRLKERVSALEEQVAALATNLDDVAHNLANVIISTTKAQVQQGEERVASPELPGQLAIFPDEEIKVEGGTVEVYRPDFGKELGTDETEAEKLTGLPDSIMLFPDEGEELGPEETEISPIEPAPNEGAKK